MTKIRRVEHVPHGMHFCDCLYRCCAISDVRGSTEIRYFPGYPLIFSKLHCNCMKTNADLRLHIADLISYNARAIGVDYANSTAVVDGYSFRMKGLYCKGGTISGLILAWWPCACWTRMANAPSFAGSTIESNSVIWPLSLTYCQVLSRWFVSFCGFVIHVSGATLTIRV